MVRRAPLKVSVQCIYSYSSVYSKICSGGWIKCRNCESTHFDCLKNHWQHFQLISGSLLCTMHKVYFSVFFLWRGGFPLKTFFFNVPYYSRRFLFFLRTANCMQRPRGFSNIMYTNSRRNADEGFFSFSSCYLRSKIRPAVLFLSKKAYNNEYCLFQYFKNVQSVPIHCIVVT